MYSKKSAKQKLWNARSYLTLARKFAPNFKSKKLWIVQYCMCKLYLSKNVCLWFVKRLILPTFLFTEILLLVKRNLFYVALQYTRKALPKVKLHYALEVIPISLRTYWRSYWLSPPYCEEKHTNLGDISQSFFWEIFCVKCNITHMGTHPQFSNTMFTFCLVWVNIGTRLISHRYSGKSVTISSTIHY